MCAYLGVSESGYYKFKKRGRSVRDIEDTELEKNIIELHAQSKGDAGTRTIRADLAAKGKRHGRARIARLMRRNGICGRHIKAYRITTLSDGKPCDVPDLIKRDFSPGLPDIRWCGDITYIKTAAGWTYKATVIDIGTRRVVGWAVDTHMREELVERALKDALARRGYPKDIVYHSDRGSVYTSRAFRNFCERNHVKQSMGRTGVCWDNAVAESYFATYKKSLIFTRPWKNADEVRQETFKWVEYYYNRKRRHSSLNYLTPIEYELGCKSINELAA